MNSRQRAALELLVSHPDSVVAEMLGLRPSTVARWMGSDDFVAALRSRERQQRSGLARIARQAAVNAAAALCQAVCEPVKTDPKVLLEVLKASGAFAAETEDPGEALAQIIERATREEMALEQSGD